MLTKPPEKSSNKFLHTRRNKDNERSGNNTREHKASSRVLLLEDFKPKPLSNKFPEALHDVHRLITVSSQVTAKDSPIHLITNQAECKTHVSFCLCSILAVDQRRLNGNEKLIKKKKKQSCCFCSVVVLRAERQREGERRSRQSGYLLTSAIYMHGSGETCHIGHAK